MPLSTAKTVKDGNFFGVSNLELLFLFNRSYYGWLVNIISHEKTDLVSAFFYVPEMIISCAQLLRQARP